jgi:DNA-binding transcriptional ArsR family regulator
VLACLGVASRFRLVRELAGADRCVGELAVAVGLSQSCTTRHLQALERLGLVEGRREGRRVRFRLSAETSGLGGLIGLALAGGDGREAPDAGSDLRRDGATPSPSGVQAAPNPGRARARPLVVPGPSERIVAVPVPGASRQGEAGSDGTPKDPDSRPAPTWDDLEDYLL